MSLNSKVEKEAEKRAEQAFEKFLKSIYAYAGDGQKINLHTIVAVCNRRIEDKDTYSTDVGPVSFKRLMLEAYKDTNMDYFKDKVEDDIYKGAMKGLEDKNE